jgi:hypothetical protein
MPHHVHDIDTLEKAIHHLRLRKVKLEKRLDENVEYLQQHYASMAMHSVFRRREKTTENGRSHVHEKLSHTLDFVVDRLLDKTADGIEQLVQRILRKKDAGHNDS